MKLDQKLVDAAIELLDKAYPNKDGIAAAMYSSDGDIFSSIMFLPDWGGGGLCAETGALLEANKLGKQITASVCVSRLTGESPIVILSPCGICQERLFHWGGEVEVAVPHPDNPSRWQAKTLNEVQPYYWVNVYQNSSGSDEKY
jgi:cytidine deaminase